MEIQINDFHNNICNDTLSCHKEISRWSKLNSVILNQIYVSLNIYLYLYYLELLLIKPSSVHQSQVTNRNQFRATRQQLQHIYLFVTRTIRVHGTNPKQPRWKTVTISPISIIFLSLFKHTHLCTLLSK